MNVSEAEYTKMLKIYKQSVQQSKVLTRLQQLTSGLDRSITDHLHKTFNFQPTGKFLNQFYHTCLVFKVYGILLIMIYIESIFFSFIIEFIYQNCW